MCIRLICLALVGLFIEELRSFCEVVIFGLFSKKDDTSMICLGHLERGAFFSPFLQVSEIFLSRPAVSA